MALRRCTVDLVMKGDSSILNTELFKQYGMIKGMRDKSDVSYALSKDDPVDRWL
jgi:hypothetical protein